MLLCVSLVWPTKFANTLSFCVKQIWCLRIYGECLIILILGKLGLKLCFLKYISSHTHAFCSSISMLWGISKMCLCYFQNCVFSQKFCGPLSISIDPICFLINRKCFKMLRGASVCFDWSKLFLDQLKLFWYCLKTFKEASICFDQLKLIFDQSKLVNQVF